MIQLGLEACLTYASIRLWLAVKKEYNGNGGSESAQNEIAMHAATDPTVQQAAIAHANQHAHQERPDGSEKFPGER